MRLVLFDSVPITFGGGYENFLLELGAAAHLRGHRVEVLGTSSIPSIILNRALGVPIHRRLSVAHARSRGGGATVEHVTLSESTSRLRNADVVYTKNEPHEVLYIVRACAGRARIVVGFHSSMTGRPGLSGHVRRSVYRSRPYRRLLARANLLHPLNLQQERALTQDLGLSSTKIRSIPNGVDLSRFKIGTPDEHSEFRALFVGRLDRQKGIDTLIESLRSLDAGTASITVTVAGEGPLANRVRREAEEERLSFLGHVQDVSALYRCHDLLVAPSRWEVCALVPAEALASGVPVLLSDIEANIHYGDTSATRYCPPDDPSGLADAISTAARQRDSDPAAYNALRQEARRFAEDRLDQNQSLATLIDAMEDLSDIR